MGLDGQQQLTAQVIELGAVMQILAATVILGGLVAALGKGLLWGIKKEER